MAATIPPTVTAHYLVTLSVPFDVDASTDPNVLTFRAGAPTTDVRRLTPHESATVIQALTSTETQQLLEETLTPVTEPTPSTVEFAITADATKTVEALRSTARTVRAQTTTKTARKTTKGPKPTGRRVSPASLAINDALRQALAEGKSTQEAAEAAGVTLSSARQRILKHKLRQTTNATTKPIPAPAPAGLDKPVVPRVGTPRPTPGPKPGRPVNGNAIALGAKRRIQSLIAIGYSPKGLGQYLPGGSDFTIDDVLGLPDGSEISLAAFAEIDRIWRMKRYSPLPEAVWAPNIDRAFPPPGLWANIDDPNEHHGELAS